MPPEGTVASAPSAPVTTPTQATSSPNPGTQGGGAPERASPGTQSRSPGQAQPAREAAPGSSPELFDVKVNGRTMKMTRDELIQHASAGYVSQERFQQAAQLRKEAESILSKNRDPRGALEQLLDPKSGVDREELRQVLEDIYNREYIEPESLSKEQKELRDAQARLKKYEEDEKAREDQKQKEHLESLTAEARRQIQTQIIEALDTNVLPKTNFTLQRLAYWAQVNKANGFNAPAAVLVGQVRKEFNNTMRSMVEASEGEVLIKLFEGTDIINKVRRYDLKRLQDKRSGGQPQQGEAPQQAPGEQQTDKHGRALRSADVNQRIRELQKTGKF